MAQKAIKQSWLMGVFAFIAALALVCICATPAFAASGLLKVVPEEGSHSYQAYQLFACDVNADGSISNVSTDGCMPADFYADAFTSSRAQEMAEEVSHQINGPQASAYAAALSRIVVAHSEGAAVSEFETGVEVTLGTGVYMLISHDAQPILVTVGGGAAVVVNEKSTLPSVSKEVASAPKGALKANNLSYGLLATSGITQQMVFRVMGTLPSNYEAFDTYRYAFVDTPSKGIVIDPSTVLVSLIDDQGKQTMIPKGYTTTYEQGVLRVAFEDLKQSVPAATNGCKIMVTYSAALDTQKAELGFDQGNPNSVVIEYRRSPSYDELGTTKPSITTTFTFALSLVKVDASDAQKFLSGARFELKDSQGIVVATATTDESGYLSVVGIAPGKYQLVEKVAPSGYKALSKPIEVEISADTSTLSLTASVSSDAAKLVSVDAAQGTISLSMENEQIPPSIFPQTGDVALRVLFGFVLIALVAGVTIIVLAVRNKQRRD